MMNTLVTVKVLVQLINLSESTTVQLLKCTEVNQTVHLFFLLGREEDANEQQRLLGSCEGQDVVFKHFVMHFVKIFVGLFHHSVRFGTPKE